MAQVFKKSIKCQYFSTIRMNLISLSYGTIVGWTSPFLPLLESNESPLESGPITMDEASWIGSLLAVAAIVGTLFFGWVTERFSPKIAGWIIAILQIISWLLILFGTNVYDLYIARFIGGLSGGALVMIPIYVIDLSHDKIRGALGSILMFSIHCGVILSFIIGAFLSYHIVTSVMLCIPILFLISFVFFPETPGKWNKCNRRKHNSNTPICTEEVISTIYTNELDNLNKEPTSDNTNILNNSSPKKSIFSEFALPSTWKVIIFSIALVSFSQLCGSVILLSYTASIFDETGSNFSSNVSAIIIGIVKIFGSTLSIILVDRCGRKLLYIGSAFGCFIGLFIFASYSFLDQNDYNVVSYNWIPVVSFSFVIFVASGGILPLTIVITSELSPQSIRGIIITFSIILYNILSFILLKNYYLLVEFIGIYGAFWFFSICCLIALVFIAIFIPETKGKSIEAIIESLK